MAALNSIIFTFIPMIALLCNIFLLFTLLTAKKDASIYSFMGLLMAFIFWAGGAYLMRSRIYPGVGFWWKVSLSGIFLVPYMYYLLMAAYVGKKGYFLRLIFGIITALEIVLNIGNVFMTEPVIEMVNGHMHSSYQLKWPAVIPILFTVVLFIFIAVMIGKVLRDEDMLLTYMSPLFAGVAFMLVGILINTIFSSIPTDTGLCNQCDLHLLRLL